MPDAPLTFVIREEDGKYCVYSQDGKKLGEHDSRAEAEAQLRAIEANKHKMAEPFRMEVFATGNHGGLEWSEADLDEIVANFTKLREFIKPPIKLGHANQIIATKGKDDDGQPALGWIENLARTGSKLVADVAHMPTLLRDAIAARRYARVSSELYPQFELTSAEKNLKTGVKGKVLSGVALLGAAIPAVKNLADLQALLATEGITAEPIAYFADDEPVTPMVADAAPLDGAIPFPTSPHPSTTERTMAEPKPKDDKDTPQPDAAAVKLQETVDQQAAALAQQAARLEEQAAELKRMREREQAADARARHMEAVRFVDSCMTGTNLKCTQAQKPFLIALHEKLSAYEPPLLTLAEVREFAGKGLRLLADTEAPRDMSAKECLEAFVAATPDTSMLLRTMSTVSQQPVDDLQSAVEAICFREKWDPKKPEHIAKATEMAILEQPHLKPVYGGRAIYGRA